MEDKFNDHEDRFLNGDCLNLAVALHDALQEMGEKSTVTIMMRSVTPSYHEDLTEEELENETQEVLSHAILYHKPLDPNPTFIHDSTSTYDINGSNALSSFESKFNQIQIELGDAEEEFWCEIVNSDLNECCKLMENTYGCQYEGKLINNTHLRDEIKKFILSLDLVVKYKNNMIKKTNLEVGLTM